jgi:phospholipid/cholesterol/gamma-HCH transport system substrate-binding protein
MAATVQRKTFEWRQARVAILLAVGVLLLIWGIYRVGKIFDVFADRYTIVTLLPNVAGLREGALVSLAGQRIGKVEEIDFIPLRAKRGGNHLLLKLEVGEGVRDQIRTDSRAMVRAQGVLGDKFIDITPGSLRGRPLDAGDTIPASTLMDIEQFLVKASNAMDRANLVVDDLREITGSMARGEGTVGAMLRDDQLYNRMVGATNEVNKLLVEINRGEGALSRMIYDPELYHRMVSAAARVDSLGGLVMNGGGSLSRLLRSDTLYRGLVGMTAKGDAAAAEFSALMQKVNGTNGTFSRMLTDPRLFDELLKSVTDLQTLLADVRQNPKKYVPDVNVKVF